jgi:electron transfer flavoprotein beta subunit
MHSLVAIKQVPDTTNVRINPETGNLIREGVPAIINPYDAHAVEVAVRLKEQFGGKVTVISMGPPKAAEAILECIEQGADRGILVTDRKFAAADTLATSYVLAHTIEQIQKEDPIDLFLFGMQAIDGDTAQVGPGVATRLGLPCISYAVKVESVDPEAGEAVIHRLTERGIEVLRTSLPVVLTVEKEIAPIARAPLSSIIRAVEYEVEVWTASEPFAFDVDKIGIKGSPTIVGKAFTPPPPEPGPKVTVAESGLAPSVSHALHEIDESGVIAFLDLDLSAAAALPTAEGVES